MTGLESVIFGCLSQFVDFDGRLPFRQAGGVAVVAERPQHFDLGWGGGGVTVAGRGGLAAHPFHFLHFFPAGAFPCGVDPISQCSADGAGFGVLDVAGGVDATVGSFLVGMADSDGQGVGMVAVHGRMEQHRMIVHANNFGMNSAVGMRRPEQGQPFLDGGVGGQIERHS
ncbi:MAG: hypothetical protein EBY66_06325, partial [Candidatus Fonsibacter lacus]|nr:hypothetical protein [Candidatus Fonsibacter lacus]